MKYRIVIFIALWFYCQSYNDNTTEVNNEIGSRTKVKSGVASWLYDIDFPDEYNGWAVGLHQVNTNAEGVILQYKNTK